MKTWVPILALTLIGVAFYALDPMRLRDYDTADVSVEMLVTERWWLSFDHRPVRLIGRLRHDDANFSLQSPQSDALVQIFEDSRLACMDSLIDRDVFVIGEFRRPDTIRITRISPTLNNPDYENLPDCRSDWNVGAGTGEEMCSGEIEDFADQVSAAVGSRDFSSLINLGADRSNFEDDQFSPAVLCQLYGGEDCSRWIPQSFTPVASFLENTSTYVVSPCNDGGDECWLTFVRQGARQETLELPEAYMRDYVTTKIRLESGCWRLHGILFETGAGNPGVLQDYG